MKEKRMLNHPKLKDEKKVHESDKLEKEVQNRKEQISEAIPKEIIEKLNPEERSILFRIIESNFKEKEPKQKEQELKDEKSKEPKHKEHELKESKSKDFKLKEHKPDLVKCPLPNHELEDLKDMQKIELMIQLCGSKHELIKLLNDINRILLENNKEHYHVNVKKRK